MSESFAFNPTRLTLARKRRGLTKIKLAEAVDVEVRSVSAWEHGEYVPEVERLGRISSALRFPIEFFSGPDLIEPLPDGVSFRSFTRMTAAQRDMALGAGAIAFSLSDWIESQFELPSIDLPDLARDLGPEGVADSLRQCWGLGELPIKNLIHLLESRGVRVFSLAIDAAEVDAFSTWHSNKPYIFLNTNKSAEHSRFDAAHELGHLIMHRHGSPQGQIAEHEANAFASAFLMPRRSVLAHISNVPAIPQLVQAKKYWGVSVAALAYRLFSLRLVTEWQYRSLFVEIARKGYRKNEPDEMPREMSQVLAKVFNVLRQDGVKKSEIYSSLSVLGEEINSLVFGLALTGLDGGGVPRSDKRGDLSLVPTNKK